MPYAAHLPAFSPAKLLPAACLIATTVCTWYAAEAQHPAELSAGAAERGGDGGSRDQRVEPSPASFDEIVPADLPPHVQNQVLVRVRKDAGPRRVAEALQSVGGRVVRSYTSVPELKLVEVAQPVREAICTLGRYPDVVLYAEPNYYCELAATPSDTRFSDQYGMELVRAPRAWDVWTGDPNFVVGVIDSGLDVTHPDILPNLWTNPDEVPGNGVDDDNNGLVDDVHGWNFHDFNDVLSDEWNHGTHVTGILGAAGNNGVGVAGVCWQVKVLPMRYWTFDGTYASAASCLDYLLSKGVKLSNNSYGGSAYSQGFEDIIIAARSAGHLLIAASGNESSSTPRYPGRSEQDNVICVAAVGQNDQFWTGSNVSTVDVDLAAPGIGVLSTVPGGGYELNTGTSMAAPHVTGAAALLWSLHPDWNYLDVRESLLGSVRPVGTLASRTVTGGVLDIGAAASLPKPLRVVPPVVGPTEALVGSSLELSVDVAIELGEQDVLSVRVKQVGQEYAATTMTRVGATSYRASIVVGECPGRLEYYFAATQATGEAVYPLQGPGAPLTLVVLPDPASVGTTVFFDDFAEDKGWGVGDPTDTATTGRWARAVSERTLAQPEGDRHSPTGVCFVTDPDAGPPSASVALNDVDGGATSLISPAILVPAGKTISVGYWLWFSTNQGANPVEDVFRTYISTDNGETWQLSESVGPGGQATRGGWQFRSFTALPGSASATSIRLMFVASDSGGLSVVEAAIDDVFVAACQGSVSACAADFDQSGAVSTQDIFDFLAAWFQALPSADFNASGTITVQDIFEYLAAWFAGC